MTVIEQLLKELREIDAAILDVTNTGESVSITGSVSVSKVKYNDLQQRRKIIVAKISRYQRGNSGLEMQGVTFK